MCNLYGDTRGQAAIIRLFPSAEVIDRVGNMPPLPSIYPDQNAPIVRANGDELELVMARWGLPSPPEYHSKSGIDRGVTNVRNTGSPHWRRWLGPEHRCLVPLERFAEPRQGTSENIWFTLADERPAFFAAIHVPQWTSIRKLKDGPTTDDLFGFLTTDANADVSPYHPKAMPVILDKPNEWEAWLSRPWAEARALQRPLENGALIIERPSASPTA